MKPQSGHLGLGRITRSAGFSLRSHLEGRAKQRPPSLSRAPVPFPRAASAPALPRCPAQRAQPITPRSALRPAPPPATVTNQSAMPGGQAGGRGPGGGRTNGRDAAPARCPLAPRSLLAPSLAMAAAVAGLRASYHRLLDRIELMLPPRFRPFYNHPAGNGRGSPWPPGWTGGRAARGMCSVRAGPQ